MATKVLANNVLAVMADISKYIEHIEEEEKRSHPFGVTNVLLNGLNGRKSKTTLDTGRSLTWICFFCLVLGVCGTIIFLSARAANEAKEKDCKELNLCDHTVRTDVTLQVQSIDKPSPAPLPPSSQTIKITAKANASSATMQPDPNSPSSTSDQTATPSTTDIKHRLKRSAGQRL